MVMTGEPREVIRRHSRSFSLAARLLAPEPRRRAEALYAWCRSADDAIDLAPSAPDALAALNALREDLNAVYEGRPTFDPLWHRMEQSLHAKAVAPPRPRPRLDARAIFQ